MIALVVASCCILSLLGAHGAHATPSIPALSLARCLNAIRTVLSGEENIRDPSSSAVAANATFSTFRLQCCPLKSKSDLEVCGMFCQAMRVLIDANADVNGRDERGDGRPQAFAF